MGDPFLAVVGGEVGCWIVASSLCVSNGNVRVTISNDIVGGLDRVTDRLSNWLFDLFESLSKLLGLASKFIW